MIRDVGAGFQVIGAIHVAGIPLLLWWGMRFFRPRFTASAATAFGVSALFAAISLFAAFMVLTPRSDRGMGIIVMLLYPAVEALLAATGIVTLIVQWIKTMKNRGGGRET